MITMTISIKVRIWFYLVVVLVGDAGVGKTHIISRYIKGTLPKVHYPTIGVEFATRNVPLKSGGVVKAQIWDTAGQERYQAITAAHYKRARGAIIVYDITKQSTFFSVKKWIDALKTHAGADLVIMLVGNKLDLVTGNPKERKVPRDMAEKFAKENNLLFDEASAVSNVKVKESFEQLMEAIYNEQSKVKNSVTEERGVSLSGGSEHQTRADCCI